jgi:hypothetical protein
MSTWPEDVGRRILTATDSTMAEAARRAEAGVPGPEWTLALHQTKPLAAVAAGPGPCRRATSPPRS